MKLRIVQLSNGRWAAQVKHMFWWEYISSGGMCYYLLNPMTEFDYESQARAALYQYVEDRKPVTIIKIIDL